MKLIKNYNLFLEAFMAKDKEKAIGQIISYLEKKTGIDLHPYDELFHIQKGNEFLNGQLFISLLTSKALRINWKEGDVRTQVHSIDMWMAFEFESNPDYSLIIADDASIVGVLPEISKFFNDPEQYVEWSKEMKLQTTENYDPKSELEDWEKKRKRAKSTESIEKIERRIKQLTAVIAMEEKAQKDSDKITNDDLKIDIFKAIELYTIQVAKGRSNSLIVSGQAGVGKTSVVIETLKSIGFIADHHYYKSTGTITTAGLYEVLFKNRNKLVIFDDCDSVLKDADSINLLKGALDTYPVRELSKITKGTTFDSTGMSDLEIEEKWLESDGKLLPNRFAFTGQIIFVSNLAEDKFDDAILSRSLHVDVNLKKEEVINRMRQIMSRVSPEIDQKMKEEALEYLVFITDNYPVKFDLNIRTLIHSINLRAGNDETISIGGKEEPVWKLLIKKYLVKTK